MLFLLRLIPRNLRVKIHFAQAVLSGIFITSLATASNISSINIKQHSDRALVEFQSTEEIDPRVFTLKDPQRLVIDLESPITASTAFHFESGDWFKSARSARRDDGTRIVIDLNKPLQHREIATRGQGFSAFIVEVSPILSSPTNAQTSDSQGGSNRPVSSPAGRDLVVVIDAGHGGKDPGAVSYVTDRRLLEKHIVLSVARHLASLLRRTKGIEVLMTRETDVYIPLRSRYALARKHEADLFISIHADSAPSKSAKGASIYTLSKKGGVSPLERFLEEHANVELAQANDRIAGIQLDDEEDFNKAVADLASVATENASSEFAVLVLEKLRQQNIPLLRREPGRANFVVLRSPDVPSVLVETGFLTNETDAKNLDWAKYRRDIAWALYKAVREHFTTEAPSDSYLAVADSRFVEFEVVPGDSVSALATLFGVKTQEILRHNTLKGGILRVGQTLRVPIAD